MRSFLRTSGVVTFVSFMLVVGLGELGVRQIKDDLPVDPGKWPRPEVAQKLDRLGREVERGRHPEVVFTGSSVMAGGVDPVAFSKASGVPSYNAAWAGSTARTTALWTLDVVQPVAKPDVVVFGAQTGELNDNAPKGKSVYEAFSSSPGYEQAVSRLSRQLEGRLEKISEFVRNRVAFRKPEILFRKDRAALEAAEVKKEIGARGRRVEEPRNYRLHRQFREEFAGRNLKDLSFGGREYRAVVRMHDRLAKKGVKLIFMATAVTDDYYTVHPDPEGDRAAFRRLLERFRRETGGTVIDASDAFSSTGVFRDPVHLDVQGRKAMAVALGERWDDIAASSGTAFVVRCTGPDDAPDCEVKRRR